MRLIFCGKLFAVLSWLERLVDPYPEDTPTAPPKGFFAFVWANTQGMRPFLLGMTLLTASIGAFEALLFNMLGSIVDWLSRTPASQLWAQQRGHGQHQAWQAGVPAGCKPHLHSRLRSTSASARSGRSTS